MRIKNFQRLIFFISLAGLCIFLLVFIVSGLIIGRSVNQYCRAAQKDYNGDCVEALIVSLNNENNSFRIRNTSIWALGQIGDKRALPVLQKYYTGDVPPEESLDKGLSQYELEKAIKLASGGFNITAFLWRYGF